MILGIAFILVGAALLLVGGVSASNWVDTQQSEEVYFGLAFFAKVVAPLLGGAILVMIGLMEVG